MSYYIAALCGSHTHHIVVEPHNVGMGKVLKEKRQVFIAHSKKNISVNHCEAGRLLFLVSQ